MKPINTVSIWNPKGGQGKSMIAINLAAAAVQIGLKPVLAIHNGYSDEQKARDGMAEILSSQDLIEAQEMTKRCLNSGYKDC